MVRSVILPERRQPATYDRRRDGRYGTVAGLRRMLLGFVTAGGLACGGVADEGKLPPDVQDPGTLKTPSGAIARYRGALATLPGALDHYLTTTGVLTDELAANPAPLGVGGVYTGIDSRTDLTAFEADYNLLHHLRGQAREARGFLQAYAPDSSPALAGQMYTLEGYAEVLLADLFCSGIPLSTVDFNENYTLAPGSSTADVYRHALALFDTALTLESDSVTFQHFTAVARGRALLALGRYGEAAVAVATVPDGYSYQVQFVPGQVINSTQLVNQRLLAMFVTDANVGYFKVPAAPGMADNEGGNGLPYRSSNDPRTPDSLLGQDVLFHDYYFPIKYPAVGSVTLTVANSVEARLIDAESAWQQSAADGQWLAKLNALRTDGAFDTQQDPNDPNKVDTLWHAGTGGVAGLKPLEDPGVTAQQIDLLFRERAFWLYLTGHRQGDLRRLARAYLRDPDAAYPTGGYPGGPGQYGQQLVAPVPESEKTLNTKYTGCMSALTSP